MVRRPLFRMAMMKSGTLVFFATLGALLLSLGTLETSSVAAVPIIAWPSCSGTMLPAIGGFNVTIRGSGFSTVAPGYNLTLSTDPSVVILPVFAGETSVVFNFNAAALGSPGTSTIWTLNDIANKTALTRIPVMSSSSSVVMPYSRSYSLPVDFSSATSSTLRLLRANQNIVYMQLQDIITVTASGNAQIVSSSIQFPLEFRPERVVRCYTHIIVNGSPPAELHADILPEGIVKFGSNVQGDAWPEDSGGNVYFNGCSWIAPF